MTSTKEGDPLDAPTYPVIRVKGETLSQAAAITVLLEDCSFEVILKDVRASITGPLRPLYLLERTQIHNIKRQFKITHNERGHKDDHISDGLWA
ncbi:hypothetical protein HPB47_005658 [Ixodes persulcatus]|uniref:Uncharacterized protein n=1 Tax=Ixodes persulcatus TaxID=34615 RepID=A0AC60PDM6_IXOPE|nr:hypothetical protein HPB47_005658 [Ixodes persulcatus]